MRVFGGEGAVEVVTGELDAAASGCDAVSHSLGEAAWLWLVRVSVPARAVLAMPAVHGTVAELEEALGACRRACAAAGETYGELARDLRRAAGNYERAEREVMEHPGGWLSGGWFSGGSLSGGRPELTGPDGALGGLVSARTDLLLGVAGYVAGRPPGIEGTVAAIGGLSGFTRNPLLASVMSRFPWITVGTVMHGARVVAPAPDILTEAPVPELGASPATLEGLVDLQAAAGRGQGALVVTRVEGEDGPRWVVTLPGTNAQSGTVWGVARIPEAMTDDTSHVAPAVLTALAAAGARRGDPVVFSGHSQGGRHALNLASDPVVSERYRVTGVVTVGAPSGASDTPAGVRVIQLEDPDDSVPGLDGRVSVPVSRERILVRSVPAAAHPPGGSGVFGPEHRLDNYRVTAREAKDVPAVRESMAALGLVGAATSYRVATRHPAPQPAAVRSGARASSGMARAKYGLGAASPAAVAARRAQEDRLVMPGVAGSSQSF